MAVFKCLRVHPVSESKYWQIKDTNNHLSIIHCKKPQKLHDKKKVLKVIFTPWAEGSTVSKPSVWSHILQLKKIHIFFPLKSIVIEKNIAVLQDYYCDSLCSGEEEEQLMELEGLKPEESYLECFRCDLGFWDACYTTETNCSRGELCYTGRGKAGVHLFI